MALAYEQTAPRTLTAAHEPIAGASPSAVVSGDGIPQPLIPRPRPTPSPSPSPVAAPPPAAVHVAAPRPPALIVNSVQQALINQDRARYGLGPLTWSNCLYSVALANARRIAAQGYLSHTNGPYADLACGLGRQGGENIGYWTGGINDAQLNTMFMNSPDHRANILGPYHYVATAWVVASNGTAYIAVEFS